MKASARSVHQPRATKTAASQLRGLGILGSGGHRQRCSRTFELLAKAPADGCSAIFKERPRLEGEAVSASLLVFAWWPPMDSSEVVVSFWGAWIVLRRGASSLESWPKERSRNKWCCDSNEVRRNAAFCSVEGFGRRRYHAGGGAVPADEVIAQRKEFFDLGRANSWTQEGDEGQGQRAFSFVRWRRGQHARATFCSPSLSSSW